MINELIRFFTMVTVWLNIIFHPTIDCQRMAPLCLAKYTLKDILTVQVFNVRDQLLNSLVAYVVPFVLICMFI